MEVTKCLKLADQIRCVVDVEGPVLDTVLYKRIARSWGLERTGSRIVERLRSLVPADIARTNEGEKTFYWAAGKASAAHELSPRVAGAEEGSRRHVDEVCIQELGALILHIIDLGGATPSGDVARGVCRLIGMARTPADAELRVAVASEALVAAGFLVDTDGNLRRG